MVFLRSALVAAVTLLPLGAFSAFHSNTTACTQTYTVIEGDTCDIIGQKTLTSTYQILAFNLLSAGKDCYTLEIGSTLCLGRYGNDCQFVHQSTDQDTCESIAAQYGISTQHLQDNNPSLDCDVVYQGLMLCVSAGSIRPPADDSLNSTDVKIAREQARQAWLAQDQQKQAQALSASSAKQHKTSHAHHKTNSNAKHKSGDQSSSAANHKSHKSHASSSASEGRTKSANHDSTKQDHKTASSKKTSDKKSSTDSSSGSKRDFDALVPSADESDLVNEAYRSSSFSSTEAMVEEIDVNMLHHESSSSTNHTPHSRRSSDSVSKAHQRRHRSLSTRSHHRTQSS